MLATILTVPALAAAAEQKKPNSAVPLPAPTAAPSTSAGSAKDTTGRGTSRTLAISDDGTVPAASDDEKLRAAPVVGLDLSQPSNPLGFADRDFVFELWLLARPGTEVKGAALLALGDWDPDLQACVACSLYIRRGIHEAAGRDLHNEIRDRQNAEVAERRRTRAAELVELPVTPRLVGSNDRDFVIALWSFLKDNKAEFTGTIAAAEQAFTTTPAALDSFLNAGLANEYATDQRRLIAEAADKDEAQKAESNRRFDRKKAANAVGVDIKVDDEAWMASTDDVFLRDVARRLKGVPFWSLTYAKLADEVLNGSPESWRTMIATGIYEQVELDRLRRNKEIIDGYKARVTEVRDAAIRDGYKNIARAGTAALASNSISALWSYLEKRESLPPDATEMTLLKAAGTNTTAVINRGQLGRWWSTDRQVYKSGSSWDLKKSRPYNGDFNGDGKRDVAVLYGAGASWRVQFFSNIDATAPTPKLVWDSPANSAGKGYDLKSAAAGDINGDGRTDLAIYGKNAAAKSVLLTLTPAANGTWAAKEITAPDALVGGRLVAGDISGDKKADLITINQDATKGMQIWVALTSAAGAPGTAVAKWADKNFSVSTTTEPVVANFNKDAVAELALFRKEKEKFSDNGASLHLFSRLSGTVVRSEAWRIEGGLGAAKIILPTPADVNGDDYVDLLVHYAIVDDQTRTYVVLNSASGFNVIKQAGIDSNKIADLRIAR
ncbi:VCBS repeat-containing protein [Micromonospora sp. KC721]|uniref:FG-GAP repeat domain-containing protein n=1 Tax=Micromonospora sp. KC721 TaxID=2530380 RepID=UPI00104553DD|nr:VCBS repeat-containing protein [Micromonospora sp. KC721]TDB81576.1 VCBS repeat-containing protein [Micromonospora sp. KC721]